MTIVEDSRKVLKELYNLITEDSYALVVEFKAEYMCRTVNMTKEHLNLCVHYLVLGGYITGDFAFNPQSDSMYKLAFTAMGIDKVENTSL